jgi:Ankyrin repeats (3 copies)/Ankyrin repeat
VPETLEINQRIPIVATREELDELLTQGADINARSDWWAGGFGLLDSAPPAVAHYAITRGATLSAHAAARLGLLADLRRLIDADPTLVHQPGGDGQTPLHFASTVEIAALLLDRGADINALDVDHESTPAQYMIGERQAVARYLIQRGCRTDLLMAAALGDVELARRILQQDAAAIHLRVSDEYFPMVGRKAGGTIYQWQLGWYVGACQVARKFGHEEAYRFLDEQNPADERLLNACWLHDATKARPLYGISLPAPARRHLAHAARNNDLPAVKLMLAAGLPVDEFSQHHASALHWASFHGNAEMIRLLLPHSKAINNIENDYQGTPLGWAQHGLAHGWSNNKEGYPETMRLLVEAGGK